MDKKHNDAWSKFTHLSASQIEQLAHLNPPKKKKILQKLTDLEWLGSRKAKILLSIFLFCVGGYFLVSFAMANKRVLALSSLSALGKVSKFLPIGRDEKKELDVVAAIVG